VYKNAILSGFMKEGDYITKGYILYKIYYKFGIAYLGRTKQNLQDRLRGHFFAKPMHMKINIEAVTKIEYVELSTEADMFLYEIYYINKIKPPLNRDDKAQDSLTLDLPELEFKEFDCHLINKWRNQLKPCENKEDTTWSDLFY